MLICLKLVEPFNPPGASAWGLFFCCCRGSPGEDCLFPFFSSFYLLVCLACRQSSRRGGAGNASYIACTGQGEREVEGGREVGGEKKPSLRHVKLPLMPQAIVSNFFLFLFVLSPLLITHAVKGKSRVKGRTPA